MLDFLNVLAENSIHSYIEQQTPEALLVKFDLVGIRGEASFFVDHVEWGVFKGGEDVDRDEQKLLELIREEGS
ncbi:MAG: hypothetical protein ABWZ80_00295 [Beijerinckiaceae bacterium]